MVSDAQAGQALADAQTTSAAGLLVAISGAGATLDAAHAESAAARAPYQPGATGNLPALSDAPGAALAPVAASSSYFIILVPLVYESADQIGTTLALDPARAVSRKGPVPTNGLATQFHFMPVSLSVPAGGWLGLDADLVEALGAPATIPQSTLFGAEALRLEGPGIGNYVGWVLPAEDPVDESLLSSPNLFMVLLPGYPGTPGPTSYATAVGVSMGVSMFALAPLGALDLPGTEYLPPLSPPTPDDTTDNPALKGTALGTLADASQPAQDDAAGAVQLVAMAEFNMAAGAVGAAAQLLGDMETDDAPSVDAEMKVVEEFSKLFPVTPDTSGGFEPLPFPDPPPAPNPADSAAWSAWQADTRARQAAEQQAVIAERNESLFNWMMGKGGGGTGIHDEPPLVRAPDGEYHPAVFWLDGNAYSFRKGPTGRWDIAVLIQPDDVTPDEWGPQGTTAWDAVSFRDPTQQERAALNSYFAGITQDLGASWVRKKFGPEFADELQRMGTIPLLLSGGADAMVHAEEMLAAGHTVEEVNAYLRGEAVSNAVFEAATLGFGHALGVVLEKLVKIPAVQQAIKTASKAVSQKITKGLDALQGLVKSGGRTASAEEQAAIREGLEELSKLAKKNPELQGTLDELVDAASGIAPNKIPSNPFVARIQAKLGLYPKVIDPRTGRNIQFPSGINGPVDKNLRVAWDSKTDRASFIAEWHRRGYATPRGGWDKYDIHHIQPREFGGSNDFWNLVPVERSTHQQLFDEFWREFTGL